MSSSARPDATPGNLPPRSDSRAKHHRTMEIPSGQHSTASSRRYQRHSPENTALCLERLSTNAAGQAVYELKIPFRDGTTHILFSREEFFARPCRPTRRTRSTPARQPHPIPWRLRAKLAHAPRDVRLSAHSKSIAPYARSAADSCSSLRPRFLRGPNPDFPKTHSPCPSTSPKCTSDSLNPSQHAISSVAMSGYGRHDGRGRQYARFDV